MRPIIPNVFRPSNPRSRDILIGISAFAVVGGVSYTWYRHRQQQQQQQQRFQDRQYKTKTQPLEKNGGSSAITNMIITTPFQTLFAVPMTCESCVKDISSAIYKLEGITKVEASIPDQLVTIEGTAPPSAIVEAIEATGRDAILRGSGSANGAAVSILETYHQKPTTSPPASSFKDRHVRGLARLVQVNPTTTLIDLTLRGVSPGLYRATVREYGNLADGAASAGPVWGSGSGSSNDGRGALGEVKVGSDGHGSVFLSQGFQVWEVVGHALVVTRQEEDGKGLMNDEDTVVGVIARSAGVWDNDKTVCSCTGKTLWEERKEVVGKGML